MGMSFFKLVECHYRNPHSRNQLYKTMSPEESFVWLNKILEFNSIDALEFFKDVFDIMDKQLPKINTLFLKGPANAGKTMICESIARACIYFCNIQQFAKGKNFIFMDAVGKRCCMINEPRITDEHAEVLKNVLEGAPTHVDVKFQTGQMLQRTPVVCASNHDLSMYLMNTKFENEKAYRTRMRYYTLKTFSDLKECNYAFHPGMWWFAARELAVSDLDFDDNPGVDYFSQ